MRIPDGKKIPQPVVNEKDDLPHAPRGGEGWNCGNGGLGSRLVLCLVESGRVQVDVRTLEYLDNLANDAGPKFVAAMIDRLTRDQEVPF
ncbi:hypothetical protein SAMN05192583_1410 [Sphingomonas gellani]|uniref:Uncharacterized protein n=1 Tax=Sphingomonas gellani TaxID=1166340 RepID=A0A1H8C140_9SPHN|nr:hypothetical protein [Sphingomonas gellani]SEM88780.1 hypothetical protein SAMN05192583_1410 [Sphingomonas gellani]